MTTPPFDTPSLFAEKSLAGISLTRSESQAVLDWPDEEVLSLIAAAHRVRRVHFGARVRMNFLVNVQSGLCSEDCSYCSQSKDSTAPVEKYRFLSSEDILVQADRAVVAGAARLCLVASMRGPGEREMASVDESVRRVKERYPDLEVCVSLGLLKEGQAERLAAAGVNAYNHNLNTSERHYKDICSTHDYADREETVGRAKAAFLSPCSGAIFGLGESDEDVLAVAFRLKETGVDSIPINFLIPVPGTSLEKQNHLTPVRCLKILCLFRFLHPTVDLRIAGGRELHLRTLQPLGLMVANSIFIGDYLTTKGAAAQADRDMIRDLGMHWTVLPEASSPSSLPVDIVTRSTRQ